MSPYNTIFFCFQLLTSFPLPFPSSPPQNLYISPSLLPSPYYCSHHLLLILNPPADPHTKTGKHVHSYTFHSHLTYLTFLLLLTSGDISPNPSPSISHPHTQHPPSPSISHNFLNLTSIPLLTKNTLPFSCSFWNARSVCN